MDANTCRSLLVRCGLAGFAFVFNLSLAGCPQPVPSVLIPPSDASPPTMAWQTYNAQTQQRGEIVQDGQTIVVHPGEQYVVTLSVEDPDSGVKEVT